MTGDTMTGDTMTGDTMGGDVTRNDVEDRDSAAVRSLLSTAEVPAGRLTSGGLLVRGRRVRRQRRATATVAGVLLLGLATVGGIGLVDPGSADPVAQPASLPLLPGTAARPAGCAVEALALPGRATSGQVNDGSPSGRYLVGFTAAGGSLATPVRWDGTKAASIKINGIGEAHGVNDSGMVVGEGQRTSGGSFAWAYVGGKVVELPVPPGYSGAEANAVNSRGDVTGVLFTSNRTVAVVWRGVGATPRADVLTAPRGAMASGISDAGVVVGALEDGSNSVPYQWDANGQGSQLAGLAGMVGGAAHGVRGGWAYGLLSRDPKDVSATLDRKTARRPIVVGSSESVLWNLATGQATALEDRRIEAVNPRGEAVVNHTADRTAALRDPAGTVRELPGLASGAHVYAYALNDAGTLAAGTSGSAAVRWQCAKGNN
ncbi:hypothetical protein [Micromonospora rubida]|uniref:hypothetical protein n=1 Tax=Micromonospora rubida TaxID=2697657 RepID=UPI0013776908|nr:hypothetical protein [Micromonospora rubida]NBE80501.1 hypothetical protein [Micromonospora rubida]